MKQKRTLIILVVALVVLIGGAGGAYAVVSQQSRDLAEQAALEQAQRSKEAQSSGQSAGSQGSQSADAPSDADAAKPQSIMQGPKVGSPLPGFTVKTPQGDSVELASMQGKPTVLGYWASWCVYCREEASSIQELYDAYGDQVNFMMINATDGQRETPEKAKGFIDEGGYTYPYYLDTTLQASAVARAYSLPTTLILDSQGVVVQQFLGAVPKSTIEDVIKQLV